MTESIESSDNPVLLITGPDPKSFIFRHLLATVPIFLVIISNLLRVVLDRMFFFATEATTSAITSSIPSYVNQSAIAMDQYAAGLSGATDITVYVIAPVGIFILFISIGWALRATELWASALLTLGMSTVAGLLIAGIGAGALVSGTFVFVLLQWIAFLVQPFSVLAAVIVMYWSERFRRSIRYTITTNSVKLQGGVMSSQGHVIPASQIGRVVLEQDVLGSMFNYGTVIPQSITRWGAETSFRGIGATAQKDNLGVGIGYARGREEASRYPLDCLYGIPDPKAAQKLIEQLMQSQTTREDEQVSYLKKIYETVSAGNIRTGSPVAAGPQPAPAAFPDSNANQTAQPGEKPGGDCGQRTPGPVTLRIQEHDLPEAYACSVCGKKELPPYIGRDGKTYCSAHYPEKNKK